MFAAAGIAAHIGDCAAQQGKKLFFFRFREAPDHLGFRFPDGAVDPFGKFPALGQKMDPLAPAVRFIGAEFDEILLFQPGQQAGDRGVAQVEFLFNVPGTGGTFPVGDEAQDGALGGGQVVVHQRLGHPLVGAPVKDPDVVSEMFVQEDHLPIKNVASYILY